MATYNLGSMYKYIALSYVIENRTFPHLNIFTTEGFVVSTFRQTLRLTTLKKY